jgi:hypothetical protein
LFASTSRVSLLFFSCPKTPISPSVSLYNFSLLFIFLGDKHVDIDSTAYNFLAFRKCILWTPANYRLPWLTVVLVLLRLSLLLLLSMQRP